MRKIVWVLAAAVSLAPRDANLHKPRGAQGTSIWAPDAIAFVKEYVARPD